MPEIETQKEIDRAIQLVATGQAEAALPIAENLSDRDKDYVLWHIVEYYAETGQFERAKQIAEMMTTVEEDDYKGEALANIAYAYAKAGEFENALQFARAMGDNYYKAESLSSIAWRYSEIGEFVKAFAIARESSEVLNSGIVEETLEGIIDLAAESLAGLEVEDAIAATQEIRDEDYQNSILQCLARNYAEQMQRDRLLKIARLTANKKIQSIALNWLISNLVNSGEIQQAQDILRNFKIEPEYLNEMLIKQAFILYSSGKSEESLEILQFIEDPLRREKALAALKALRRNQSTGQRRDRPTGKSYWVTYYCDS